MDKKPRTQIIEKEEPKRKRGPVRKREWSANDIFAAGEALRKKQEKEGAAKKRDKNEKKPQFRLLPTVKGGPGGGRRRAKLSLARDILPKGASTSDLFLDESGLVVFSAKDHMAAQSIAGGTKMETVRLLTGISAEGIDFRLSLLEFRELVNAYKDSLTAGMLEHGNRMRAKLLDLSEVSTNEVQRRLATKELRENIPISELRKLIEMGLDRTVAPPKISVTTVSAPTEITLSFHNEGATPKALSSPTIDVESEDPEGA